ncbi:hypothetical protein GOODEAATRI_001800 [Goodea atripinnis]|uniref:Uncharacterized protein n=1 Tax=Goodea atripinnis TaxID=208336 RepID=A0ABV0ME79_9TELE
MGIGTWTWEYKVCMRSVSDSTTSIVVCLYVGRVDVSVMWGLFPPCHTPCRWLVSLVVLGVQGWVLWCVLAHFWWLLALLGLCWGVVCPLVSGLWVHRSPGCGPSGPVVPLSSVSVSGPRGWVCGYSHPVLNMLMKKPYIHKRGHTYTHRCLDSSVYRYTDILYIELPLNTSCIHRYRVLFSNIVAAICVSAGVEAVFQDIILYSFYPSFSPLFLSPSLPFTLLPLLSPFLASLFPFCFSLCAHSI